MEMPIKSDGNGNFIMKKEHGLSIGLVIILIMAIISSVAYAKGLEGKVNTIEKTIEEGIPHQRAVISAMTENIQENSGNIIALNKDISYIREKVDDISKNLNGGE